ncbi:DUF4326 domain-containing protein [Polymorphospora sp. 2-325]|uniref:DUF4326 domain-containing protein n=2 Tax=Micromonosporaceae TaxID=28056 RepID=A0ABV5CKQ9_9ACTN
MPDNTVYVGRGSKWGNPFAYRTHKALARYPGGDDPTATWEYEGRISGDGARHDMHHADGRITVHHVRYMTRAEIVEIYRHALLGTDTPSMQAAFPNGRGRWFGRWVGKDGDRRREYVTVEDVRRELAGKHLACWCPLDQPCHADVLLEVANRAVMPV